LAEILTRLVLSLDVFCKHVFKREILL
jgi:hypothetical protein